MARHDLRRKERVAYAGNIEASWMDTSGEQRFAKGRCLDLSEDGLRLELPVEVPVRTVVSLRFPRIQLSGSASVRYVRRAGVRFVLGFELSQQFKQQVAGKLQSIQALSSPAVS